MAEKLFKNKEPEDIQLDGETAKVGNEYLYKASSFPLQDGSKAIISGYESLPITEIVAKLAQETNLAMNNEQGYKGRRIEMSPIYPIEPGDLVLFCAVGFSYTDENGDTQYVDLVRRNPEIQLFCYKIMQKDSEAVSSRFFLDASVVTEAGESCGYIVGYLNGKGEIKQKYVTNSTNLRDIVTPSEEEHKIVKIYGQLLSHVKYSDKKARKKLSEEPADYGQLQPTNTRERTNSGLEIKVTSVPSSPGNNGSTTKKGSTKPKRDSVRMAAFQP